MYIGRATLTLSVALVAVEAKCAPMAELLVQNGADAMQTDADGATPLLLAVRAGHVPLAALLFSRLTGSASRDRAKLLEAAAACGDAAMAALVAERLGPESPPPAALLAAGDAPAASGETTRKRNSTREAKQAAAAAAAAPAPAAGEPKSPEPGKEAARDAAPREAPAKEATKEAGGGGGGKDVPKETTSTKQGLLRRITSLRGSFMPSSSSDRSSANGSDSK